MASRTILARLISAARRPRSAGIGGGAALPIGRVGSSGTVVIGRAISSGTVGGVGQVRHLVDDPYFWMKYLDLTSIGVLVLYDGWLLSKGYGEKPRHVLKSELEGYKKRLEVARARRRFLNGQSIWSEI